MKYYPFGVCRNSPENFPTDRLFTGQRLDDTGLYYYGARYYDASMGRFISADTIIPNPANPQSFNRYSYCLNNPLKYIDPSGHDVLISGVDVEDIDAALASGDYMRLVAIARALGEDIDTLIAYGKFRSGDPGVTELLESSDYDFHITEIYDSNASFTIYMDTYTELMDDPIPTVLAAEGSPAADIIGGAFAMSTGNRLWFLKWGNVRIRYQHMAPDYLGKVIREECYHYAEQMEAGTISWYLDYSISYIFNLAIRWDHKKAYNSIPSERDAKKYAGISSEKITPFWLEWLLERIL
ncbi:MAG: RHS repeat-associated core domain-containing protein [Dehalococcoidales bacterium]|nr:RHS repeat-associated core domain-containing protein [Dehalococcoidales bacterium]